MTADGLLHAHDLRPWAQHDLVWPVAGHNERLLASLEQRNAFLVLHGVQAKDGGQVGAAATCDICCIRVFLYFVAVSARDRE